MAPEECQGGAGQAPPWHELRTGWSALAAATLGCALGSTAIPPYTIGLFLKPLALDFGVSRSQMALVFTLVPLAIALSSPIMGRIIDRVGVFRTVMFAYTAQVLGFATLSLLPADYWIFLPISLVVWVLSAAAGPIALARLIIAHFDRFRGRALGINLAGIGLAAMLAPSIVQMAIVAGGWRGGYRLVALMTACGMPIVLMLIKVAQRRCARADSPVLRVAERPDLSLDEARLLRQLTIYFSLLGFCVLGYVVHFVPIITDAGVSTGDAALLQSAIGGTLILVRLFLGFLLDRYFAPRVATLLFIVTAAGFLTLAVWGADVALIGALAIGLAAGAEIDFIAYLTSRYFPQTQYSRVYGWIYGGLMVGGALAPLMLAKLFELTGDYSFGLCLSSATLLLTGCLFWRLPRFKVAIADRRAG